jgi:hypothetical protein
MVGDGFRAALEDGGPTVTSEENLDLVARAAE